MNSEEERHLARMRRKARVLLEETGGQVPVDLGGRDHVALDFLLDALAAALGVELDAALRARPQQDRDPWRAEVMEFLAAGQKLQAIKRYREAVGCGLKEALEGVEEFERNM
jgi:hypothetical protein